MKAEAGEGLYDNLDNNEGQEGTYRIAAARDRAAKDIGQICTIKGAIVGVMMKDEEIRGRLDNTSNGEWWEPNNRDK